MTAPPPPPPPPPPPQSYGQQPAALVGPRFYVVQRITMMINRYEIRAANPDGSEGHLLALAEQKRMTFKEEVTFYADESKTRRVFSFKARQRLDVHAQHDVFDEYGQPLGMFSKRFGASLLRSTWDLSAPGLQAVGQERNQFIAILRRVWDFIPVVGDIPLPFLFHFDFVAPDGSIVLSSERKRSLRDRYDIHMPQASNGWQLDWRVGLGMAVALDALQSR